MTTSIDLVHALLPAASVKVLGGPMARCSPTRPPFRRPLRRRGGTGCLVTLGSGTITDLGKLVSRETGVPLVAVQTAASVNGFSDDLSVVLRAGAKRTVASTYPAALVIDHRVLAGAPVALSRAGLGECVGALVAPADWLLAAAVGADPTYDPEIVSSYHRPAGELMGIAGGVGRARNRSRWRRWHGCLPWPGWQWGRPGGLLRSAGPSMPSVTCSIWSLGEIMVCTALRSGWRRWWRPASGRLPSARLDLERTTAIPDDAVLAAVPGRRLDRLDPEPSTNAGPSTG